MSQPTTCKAAALLLLTILPFLSLNAQILNTNKLRFGKISDTEMELTSYAPDPEAEAVVLFDEGMLRMELDPTRNTFEYVLDRHIRIKILKASATDYATFSFLLESSENSADKEELISPKGATYNLVNGKIEDSKLNKDGIFEEKVSDNFNRITLSFPQVKEGSLIELKYTYKSDFLYNLPTWYFQREIPVDYSFYEAIIPEYYSYNLDMKGYASNTLTENVMNKPGQGSVTMKVTPESQGLVRTPSTDFSRSSAGNSNTMRKIDFGTLTYRWAAKEVPALAGESFAPNAQNFFFRIGFELASTNFPGQAGKSFSRSWENVSDTYKRFSNHGPYLNPRKEVEELAQSWMNDATDEQAKMVRIYEGVKQNFSWNSNFRISVEQNPSQLIKLKSGSSADLNYLLLSSLRAAGINAEPVLLSTRQNGYLSLSRASLSQFNHVIVLASLADGTSLLLDATQRDIPAGLLPAFDLVDQGRLITAETSDWVSIVAPASEKTAVQLKLSLTKAGQMSGSGSFKDTDYAAVDLRRELGAESGMASHLQESFKVATSEVTVEDFTNPYQDIVTKANVDASDYLTQQDDFYYVQAIIAKRYAENPFKTEARVLPIDLVKPQEHVYVMSLELEEGLRLEEMPENVNFSLEGGKARYSLRFMDLGDKIQVIEKLSIKESFFGADEYAALKNFFDLVIENQQITLVVKGE